MTANRIPGWLLLVLFFFSGGCGLVYEVAWIRLFTPVIGNTVFSVSAILSVFMAGLAIGSRWTGRRIDTRTAHPIRVYGLIEVGLGLYNLAIPWLLSLADPLFGALYRSFADSPFVLSLGRLGICVALLIVPSTLMGATLPLMVRFFSSHSGRRGFEIGRAYSVNTWGAAVGTALAGFLLIPWAGTGATLVAAASASIAIGVAAVWLSRVEQAVPADTIEPGAGGRGPRWVPWFLFVSGMATLTYEVAWTRVLVLSVGPTTYAFTLMLTAMIAGLGLGGAAGSLWVRRRRPELALTVVEIGVAIAGIVLILMFGRLPLWIGRLVGRFADSFAAIQTLELLIFFGLLLIPTALIGMSFPLAAELYASRQSRVGTDLGVLYSMNTVGGIAGSLLTGFFLIPWIGTQRSLEIAGLLSLVCAAIVIAGTSRRRLPAGLVLMALTGSLIATPRWDPELMTSGAYKYSPYYSGNADLETTLKGGELIYFKEGASATVSVRRLRGGVTLAIDGKVDATDSGDMTTQMMLGHLPLLLAPSPRSVAVIGLGSGVTAGAVLKHPVERLEIIEVSPEVVEASVHFDHVNGKALDDPRTRLFIGDGRNHMRYATGRYDVTISEPSNPWMAGMAALFSREFFEEVKSRLNPGGLHCQWVHSYNMSTEDLRTIVGTFHDAFPSAVLWTLNENDFLLIGSVSPLQTTPASMQAAFDRVRDDLATIGVHDLFSIVSTARLVDADLSRFAGDAQRNTGDLPIVEFRAPRYIYANTSEPNMEAIDRANGNPGSLPFYSLAEHPSAANLRNKAHMYLAAESYVEAAHQFAETIRRHPDDLDAWRGLIDSQPAGARFDFRAFADEALSRPLAPQTRAVAAELLAQLGETERAVSILARVLQEFPSDALVLEKLADVYATLGSRELPAILDRLFAVDPSNHRGLFHLATIRFYQGQLDESIRLVQQSLARNPRNHRARNLLAIAFGQTFQPDKAEAEFRRSMAEDPEDWVTLNNFALYLLERGEYDRAQELFAEAIDLNSENVQALVGMGEALRMNGQAREAPIWYQRALKLDPNHPVARKFSASAP